MFNIRVYQVNGRRFKKLKDELGYLTSAEFLRTIPLREEGDELLDYMERVSPKDSETVSQTKLWLHERGLRKLLPRFSTGWRIKRITTGSIVSWQITHILTTDKLKGARAKFFSIESGSRASQWTPTRSFKFLDAAGRWHAFSAGHSYRHQSTEPAHVITKASEFTQLVLVPRIAKKVNDIVRRRFDAI